MNRKAICGMMLTMLLASMLTLTFNIQPVKAEEIPSIVTDPSGDPLSGYLDDDILEVYATSDGTIHWGSDAVKESEYFNFGIGDIYWSIANEERGYFYGSSFSTPTVFFADKIENYWGSYDSYQGVQYIWEFTSASDHEWFTQHCITFAEETSSHYTGILLVRQGDLYGAIKPKSIHDGDLMHPADYVLEYDWWYDDSGGSDFSSLEPAPPVVTATIDVDPDKLNLKSEGKWITAYIQLPEGHNPEDIDAATILLNETIQPVLDPKYDFVTDRSEYLVDHNEDGILERMAKFERAEVMSLLSDGEATLTITGQVGGIPFEGSDKIRVIDK